MKKLMIAAVAGAMASVTLAGPQVYDYKASVKFIDLKEVTVTYNKSKVKVYQKFQKSASLKGYLVQDTDGATSPYITAAEKARPLFPKASVAKATDQGRNRAFLIVKNNGASPKACREAKILPAVLDAKWIDTKFNLKNPLAEGYLFVGGDVIAKGVRPKLDRLLTDANAETYLLQQVGKTALATYNSYGWTSVYLFGQYNGPQWNQYNYWNVAQTAIFKNFTEPFKDDFTGVSKTPFFHDTWMNCSGIGKATYGTDPDVICCGMATDGEDWYVLDTLSGNLKGGLFICSENGYLAAPYEPMGMRWWEDQFFTEGIIKADIASGYAKAGDYCKSKDLKVDGSDDWDQPDLWQDGDIELNTTDVITGTWSLKRNSKSGSFNIGQIPAKKILANPFLKYADVANVYGLAELTETIAGCAYVLDGKTERAYARIIGTKNMHQVAPTASRFEVPLTTPDFNEYYFGLK